MTTLREQFNASGLKVERETDITTNVLTALRLDNARKLELIDAWIPRVFHRPFGVFAGIAGTRTTPASRPGSCATQRTAGKEHSGTGLTGRNPKGRHRRKGPQTGSPRAVAADPRTPRLPTRASPCGPLKVPLRTTRSRSTYGLLRDLAPAAGSSAAADPKAS